MTNKIRKSERLLKELQESIARKPSPFTGMTKEQVIAELRKTREKLWEEKLASHS